MNIEHKGHILDFKKYDEKLYKLGLIKFDLKSILVLHNMASAQQCDGLVMYCSKLMAIHINEAIKYFRFCEFFVEYEELRNFNRVAYEEIINEANFDDNDTFNSRILKDFRGASIHYRDDNSIKKMKSFNEVLSDALNYIKDEKPNEPSSIEDWSNLFHFNMHAAHSEEGIIEYTSNIAAIVESICQLIDQAIILRMEKLNSECFDISNNID